MVLAAPYTRKKRALIEDAVRRGEAVFAPDVVRIKYYFSEDWLGEPSVYFRVLIRDEAGQLERLKSLSWPVRKALIDEVQTDECELGAYFEFRTVSEQLELRDPAWE